MGAVAIPEDEALKLQLAAIAGNEPPSSFFELRPLTPEGRPAPRDRAFIPVRELNAAGQRIRELAPRLNVYIGAAPRVRENGTAQAVERVWTLWADLDGREALARLAKFRPLPSLVIRTGSTDHAHAYWPLREPVSPAGAQRACRRLALALGGDMAATDPARILRPAGSLNHKRTPPEAVRCTRLELNVFTVEQVAGTLADSPHYAPRPARARVADSAAGSPEGSLAGVARFVSGAPAGNRNHALNWAAYTIGPKVAAGELDDGQVREELRRAALAAGLAEHEAERTIHSGLTAGSATAGASPSERLNAPERIRSSTPTPIGYQTRNVDA
jgi:hypothetical protein